MPHRTADRRPNTTDGRTEPSDHAIARNLASLADRIVEAYRSLGLSDDEALRRSQPCRHMIGALAVSDPESREGRQFREQLLRLSEDIANITGSALGITGSALGVPREVEQQLIRLGFALARIKA